MASVSGCRAPSTSAPIGARTSISADAAGRVSALAAAGDDQAGLPRILLAERLGDCAAVRGAHCAHGAVGWHRRLAPLAASALHSLDEPEPGLTMAIDLAPSDRLGAGAAEPASA